MRLVFLSLSLLRGLSPSCAQVLDAIVQRGHEPDHHRHEGRSGGGCAARAGARAASAPGRRAGRSGARRDGRGPVRASGGRGGARCDSAERGADAAVRGGGAGVRVGDLLPDDAAAEGAGPRRRQAPPARPHPRHRRRRQRRRPHTCALCLPSRFAPFPPRSPFFHSG